MCGTLVGGVPNVILADWGKSAQFPWDDRGRGEYLWRIAESHRISCVMNVVRLIIECFLFGDDVAVYKGCPPRLSKLNWLCGIDIAWGGPRFSVRHWKDIFPCIAVKRDGNHKLPELGTLFEIVGRLLRPAQRRQKDPQQHHDHADHHDQLDDRERASRCREQPLHESRIHRREVDRKPRFGVRPACTATPQSMAGLTPPGALTP